MWNFLSKFIEPTSIVAYVAVYIAYRQHRIDQWRTRKEIFDERFHIYDTIYRIIGEILMQGNATHEHLQKLTIAYNRSYFVFGKDFAEYVNEITKHTLDLQYLMVIPASDMTPEEITKRADTFKWLGNQYPVLREKADKLMSL